MRKLILEEWVSLDGYVADKNGQLDFFTDLGGDANKYSDDEQLKFMEGIDTILLGRKTYELFVDFWPTPASKSEVIADKLNGTKKIIFSNTLANAPWGDWPELEIIKGDAAAAIRNLKQQPGKDIVLWGSISLAQALMREGLIDEYHIQLCPTITGGGRPLFSEADNYRKMKLTELRQYDTGIIFLSYQLK